MWCGVLLCRIRIFFKEKERLLLLKMYKSSNRNK